MSGTSMVMMIVTLVFYFGGFAYFSNKAFGSKNK